MTNRQYAQIVNHPIGIKGEKTVVGMKGEIRTIGNQVKIDIYTLESGNKLIAAYLEPDNVNDKSFEAVLRRISQCLTV